MATNQLSVFESEMAQLANAGLEAERSTAGTTFLSTKGGVLSYRDNAIAGNSIDVVILSSPVERLYYASRYDPTTPVSPLCYALGPTATGLRPNQASTEKQSDMCHGCPKDQWGSAANGGKGKACAEKRRLLIMTADSISTASAVEAGEVAALRTPVTSVKGFATYLQKVASAVKRPLSAVVTKISIVPDAKTQFKLSFDFVKAIDDMDVIKALMSRGEREMVHAVISAGEDEGETADIGAVTKSSKY